MTATADTIARAVEDLKDLGGDHVYLKGDPDTNHIEADLILCRVLTDLGAREVVDEWKRVKKWYS